MKVTWWGEHGFVEMGPAFLVRALCVDKSDSFKMTFQELKENDPRKYQNKSGFVMIIHTNTDMNAPSGI